MSGKVKEGCWEIRTSWQPSFQIYQGRMVIRIDSPSAPLPAQESLRWVLQQPAISTIVPAMNAMWEVEQNLQAVADLDRPIDTTGFEAGTTRLWEKESLEQLAQHAESAEIRGRAVALIR